MKNGEVRDFLRDRDIEEWTVLLGDRGYFRETNYDTEKKTYSIEIQSWKAHTDDHQWMIDDLDEEGRYIGYYWIDLPEFETYEEAIRDFLKRKIWCNNTKTFWEIQEDREWLD